MSKWIQFNKADSATWPNTSGEYCVLLSSGAESTSHWYGTFWDMKGIPDSKGRVVAWRDDNAEDEPTVEPKREIVKPAPAASKKDYEGHTFLDAMKKGKEVALISGVRHDGYMEVLFDTTLSLTEAESYVRRIQHVIGAIRKEGA